MSETSGRLLSLLSLLQTPREWPGPELADRLHVTTRTVRNDVERLRALGYPVEATRGPVGGYKLVAGTAMPPLLLEDEEAVAVAVSLRTASGGAVSGMEESALRALTKLQQVLPAARPPRRRAAVPHRPRGAVLRGPAVDGGLLTLAAAARDRELVRFDYSDRSGQGPSARSSPTAWSTGGGVAGTSWPSTRSATTGARSASTGSRRRGRPATASACATCPPTTWRPGWPPRSARCSSRRRARCSSGCRPATWWPASAPGWRAVGSEPRGEDECLVTMGARTHADLAFWIGILDADFEVVDSPELAEAVERLASRYTRAAG